MLTPMHGRSCSVDDLNSFLPVETQIDLISPDPKNLTAIFNWTLFHNPRILSIHNYQPLRSGRIWHKVDFSAKFNRFEFKVSLLLD